MLDFWQILNIMFALLFLLEANNLAQKYGSFNKVRKRFSFMILWFFEYGLVWQIDCTLLQILKFSSLVN
jgi:hypothetical protein